MVRWRVRRVAAVAMVAATAGAALALGRAGTAGAASGPIRTIGAENEYANVIAQIGGDRVAVTSILNNPNTDPHTFESSPAVAQRVSGARLIVQNGVGYDAFMGKIESASPNRARTVLVVQKLLGLPASTPNPHLWYRPTTMPVVARAVAVALSAIEPSHAAFFQANERRFVASLGPWLRAISSFKEHYGGTPVATTEPVADYLLQAMGIRNLTPLGMQADIMNGVDPSPQDISLETALFSEHRVKVFVYNEQVVDSLTESFKAAAQKAGIPVVGVSETMPTPGYDYQSWMLAEVSDIERAVVHRASTGRP